jgi:hypothetical protein
MFLPGSPPFSKRGARAHQTRRKERGEEDLYYRLSFSRCYEMRQLPSRSNREVVLILDGVNGRDRLELRDLFDLRKRRIFRRTVTFNKTLFKLENGQSSPRVVRATRVAYTRERRQVDRRSSRQEG